MGSQDVRWTELEEGFGGKKDHDQVVDLTDTGNKVGEQIEGDDKIKKGGSKDQFRLQCDSGIFYEPGEQFDQRREVAEELNQPGHSEPLEKKNWIEPHLRELSWKPGLRSGAHPGVSTKLACGSTGVAITFKSVSW